TTTTTRSTPPAANGKLFAIQVSKGGKIELRVHVAFKPLNQHSAGTFGSRCCELVLRPPRSKHVEFRLGWTRSGGLRNLSEFLELRPQRAPVIDVPKCLALLHTRSGRRHGPFQPIADRRKHRNAICPRTMAQ